MNIQVSVLGISKYQIWKYLYRTRSGKESVIGASLVKAFLHSRPGYVPKAASTSYRSQVVTLQSFSPSPIESQEDERLHKLCPVRFLKIYADRNCHA